MVDLFLLQIAWLRLKTMLNSCTGKILHVLCKLFSQRLQNPMKKMPNDWIIYILTYLSTISEFNLITARFEKYLKYDALFAEYFNHFLSSPVSMPINHCPAQMPQLFNQHNLVFLDVNCCKLLQTFLF